MISRACGISRRDADADEPAKHKWTDPEKRFSVHLILPRPIVEKSWDGHSSRQFIEGKGIIAPAEAESAYRRPHA